MITVFSILLLFVTNKNNSNEFMFKEILWFCVVLQSSLRECNVFVKNGLQTIT